jgi:hypothetical protein
MVAMLIGCAPAGEQATPGEIGLKFERVSDAELTLTLANGLERTVYIQGDRTFLRAIRVWPPEGEVSCQARGSTAVTTELGTLSPGSIGTEFAAIQPNTRARIVIPTTLPQRFKGGSCSVYLHLKDDTHVGPVEFQPR